MRSRTVRYTAGEIGRVKVIGDFLPSPDALVAREDSVKVTPARGPQKWKPVWRKTARKPK